MSPSFVRMVTASAILIIALVAPASAQIPVSLCGQIVSGDAYLTDDLHCPPTTTASVVLVEGHLDLNGHTIHGGDIGVICAMPVWEQGILIQTNCSVSNGTITGWATAAVYAKNMQVADLIVSGDAGQGIGLFSIQKVRLASVTLDLSSGAVGIVAPKGVKGTNLVSMGGETIIWGASKIDLVGATITGFADQGFYGTTVKVANATITGGTVGVASTTAKVSSSTITGNDIGISGRRVQARASTVTGNGLDIDAIKRPNVATSTCDTSNGWGVCAND